MSGAVSKVTAVGTSGSLHGVMYVPAAKQPLFSVGSYLDQFGGAVVFRGTDVVHQCGSRITTLGVRTEDGLYTDRPERCVCVLACGRSGWDMRGGGGSGLDMVL